MPLSGMWKTAAGLEVIFLLWLSRRHVLMAHKSTPSIVAEFEKWLMG